MIGNDCDLVLSVIELVLWAGTTYTEGYCSEWCSEWCYDDDVFLLSALYVCILLLIIHIAIELITLSLRTNDGSSRQILVKACFITFQIGAGVTNSSKLHLRRKRLAQEHCRPTSWVTSPNCSTCIQDKYVIPFEKKQNSIDVSITCTHEFALLK